MCAVNTVVWESLNAKTTNNVSGHTFPKNIDDKYYVYLDGCKLSRVEEAKFLGITIDDNLTWEKQTNKQINNVCKLSAINTGVLNKVKRFLPEQALYKS